MSVLHLNESEFNEKIPTAPIAMVDFWATWCGPCKMLAPVVEDLGKKYEGKALIGKVDVDENQALAGKYGVMSIPTVIFFKDGKEIGRKVGVQPASVYTQTLDAQPVRQRERPPPRTCTKVRGGGLLYPQKRNGLFRHRELIVQQLHIHRPCIRRDGALQKGRPQGENRGCRWDAPASGQTLRKRRRRPEPGAKRPGNRTAERHAPSHTPPRAGASRGTELLHMCVNVPLCPLRLLRRKALITPGIGEQRLHVAVQVLEVDVVDVEADGLGAAAADEGAGTAFPTCRVSRFPAGYCTHSTPRVRETWQSGPTGGMVSNSP